MMKLADRIEGLSTTDTKDLLDSLTQDKIAECSVPIGPGGAFNRWQTVLSDRRLHRATLELAEAKDKYEGIRNKIVGDRPIHTYCMPHATTPSTALNDSFQPSVCENTAAV